MKIDALRVAEVGPFRSPVALEGFSGGLDVLIGPNELGKSNLFRAIRAVFLTRHTASGRALDELASRGGSRSPVIEADFTADGRRWRIHKRYGQGKSAVLTDLTASRVTARGADAEERVLELIGARGREGAGGQFGLLWVGQQQSLHVPTPDFDPDKRKFLPRGERATLQSAIAGEVDVVAGGALSRRLADRIAAELEDHVQPKRRAPRKGSNYERALQRRATLIAQRDHMRVEQAKAAARLDRLEQLMQERESEAGVEVISRLSAAATAAERAAAEAERAAGGLVQAIAQEEAARLAFEQASGRLERFGAALDEVAALNEERAALVQARGERARAHEDGVARLSEVERDISQLETRLDRLAAFAARGRERARLDALTGELSAQRARAVDLAAKIEEFGCALAAHPAHPERMQALGAALQDLRIAEERAARPAAVDVRFSLDEAALGRVRINGQGAEGSGHVAVDRVISVEIDGVGRFEIVPGDAQERAVWRRSVDEAREAVARIEAALGARAGREADALAAARQTLASRLGDYKAQLGATAPEGVAAIERALSEARAALEKLGADEAAGSQEQGYDGGDEAALREALVGQIKERRVQRDELKDGTHAHAFALQRAEERGQQIASRLGVLDQQLGAQAGRQAERDRLAGLCDAAQTAALAAAQKRHAMEQATPPSDQVAALRESHVAAAAALSRAQSAGVRLAQEIAALEGEIRVAGEAEIGPELARLDGEIAAATAEVAHYEHEVAALQLLQQTLADVAAENRARFLQPVTRRLGPYLRQVFDDAEVVFNDALGVETLVRGGSGEPIDLLSDGTREQLAVLVRLGFGRLLADSGSPVPLILDDALVFSDDERIARMFAALKSAADQHQVIVFTCRAATFAALAGTRLSITDWSGAA